MPSSRASAAISSCLRWNVKRPSAISSAKCFFILCLSTTAPTASPITPASCFAGLRRTSLAMRVSRRSVACRSSSRFLARSLASAGLRQATSRSPGKSGELISARSRSSNRENCNRPVSAASAAICGALRQLIQSSPAGASSSVIRAEVIMPRSPTSATCESLKRRLSLSICSRIVCGSLVLPSNTSTATGVPSGAHSNPYTICGRSGR